MTSVDTARPHRNRNAAATKAFGFFQRIQLFLISGLAWALVWLIGMTLRYRVEGWENFARFREKGQATILSFWHNQIFSATHFWRFRNIVVVTSSHFDGEYVARIIKRFGYTSARGSTTRGGSQALRALKRSLSQGADAAFTVDGPRGPLYTVKPGPIWLSRKTSAPIVPFHIEPKFYWRLNSWDGFRIPKPFSPVVVKVGRPVSVPMDGEEKTWVCRYQEEMDRLRRYCESYWRDR